MNNKKINALFLDTNIYESAKFEYSGNNLEKLFDLCQKYAIPIYINNVVKNEVLNRIKNHAKNATSGIKNEQLKAISLIYDISIDKEKISLEIEKRLINHFNSLQEKYITEISIEISFDSLLEMYFEETAPFGVSNKKEEFPDAIMLLSVQKFSKQHNINILVISNDDGVKDFCESNDLAVVKFIGHALDMLNEQFSLNKFYSIYQENMKLEIEKYIIDKNLDFNIYGYDYEDIIHAEDYSIDSVKIDDIFLINEDDSANSLTISCHCTINITATTNTYPNYETAIRDKEDGTWYPFSLIQTTFQKSESLIINFDIEIIDFNTGEFGIIYEGAEIEIQFDPYGFSEGEIIKQEYFE